jgi:hypothetical protein
MEGVETVVDIDPDRCDEPAATIQAAFDESTVVPDWSELPAAMQTEISKSLIQNQRVLELIEAREVVTEVVDSVEGDGILKEHGYDIYLGIDQYLHSYILYVVRSKVTATFACAEY